MYAQCVNSVYTVHNSKYCLPKSTNAGKKKKSRKRELKNADTEPKRTLKKKKVTLETTRKKGRKITQHFLTKKKST